MNVTIPAWQVVLATVACLVACFLLNSGPRPRAIRARLTCLNALVLIVPGLLYILNSQLPVYVRVAAVPLTLILAHVIVRVTALRLPRSATSWALIILAVALGSVIVSGTGVAAVRDGAEAVTDPRLFQEAPFWLAATGIMVGPALVRDRTLIPAAAVTVIFAVSGMLQLTLGAGLAVTINHTALLGIYCLFGVAHLTHQVVVRPLRVPPYRHLDSIVVLLLTQAVVVPVVLLGSQLIRFRAWSPIAFGLMIVIVCVLTPAVTSVVRE